MDEVEVAHGQQKARVTSDLKSELSRLQSKILKDTVRYVLAYFRPITRPRPIKFTCRPKFTSCERNTDTIITYYYLLLILLLD